MTKHARGSHVTRREVLKLGAAAAASTALPAFSRSAAAAVQRGITHPNVLFIMDDQHRGDCLGIDGHPCVKTPNMDRIGREGAYFRHGYSCTPTCTPARAALLTGLGPWRNGMLGFSAVPNSYSFVMPQAMRDNGYYTTGIGKMHWTPQRQLYGFHKTILDESKRAQSPEFRSDYRAWLASVAPNADPDATGISYNDHRAAVYALPEEYHPTQWMGMTATNFIDQYDQPEPFFLKVSFARPHSPYDPPQRFWDLYKDAEIPPAAVGKWAERYVPQSANYPDIWHGDMGEELVRQARVGYYGNVSFVDEQIGRILEALEKRGMLEETLIIFTSDHGDMTGDHHMWRKSYAYEASARIPMLMRWPEGLVAAKRGQVRDEPVELRDIFPTCLDAAGGEGLERLEGKSMLPLVEDKAPEWRKWIDLEHDICYDAKNHWSAVTDGSSKYIFHAIDGEEQLFDLTTDPNETKDLAGDPVHGVTLKTWRDRLIGHLSERGDAWVKYGQLVLRPESIKLSPNYPEPIPVEAPVRS
ncbi:MAG: choline-sulfatase [Candidatus Hydrogenedentota bacterium]